MRRLELLDYGRFFAAISVVLFHYTYNGISNGKIVSIEQIPWVIDITKYGYLGVEFFFMISGYVIFFSASRRTASKFIVSRVLRLYPSYWFAVLFTSFFTIFWGGEEMSVSAKQILINLTMLQSQLGMSNVDGVYWTLILELYFYLGVYLALLVGLQNRLEMLALMWPIVMLVALFIGLEKTLFLGGYYYYFAAGALFAIAKRSLSLHVTLLLLVIFGLSVYYSAGRIFQLQIENQGGADKSLTVIILIIMIFYSFFFFLNSRLGSSIILPNSFTLGALTYPIYLIHAHFGYILINEWATEQNKVYIYLLTISIVIAISYCIHHIVEVKLAPFWKYLLNKTIGKLSTGIEGFMLGCSRRVKEISL